MKRNIFDIVRMTKKYENTFILGELHDIEKWTNINNTSNNMCNLYSWTFGKNFIPKLYLKLDV